MAPSAKSNKKSNITLAIDREIQSALKNIAEAEGLSVNSKVNSILWKYISFYKHVEQDRTLIVPSSSVDLLLENFF